MNEENNLEKQKDVLSFEQAFYRLEEILEKMNSGTISLDDSLKLYEEADKLIHICSQRLNTAEKKIESLIKNRKGELILGTDQKPQLQEFTLQPKSKSDE